MTKFQHLSGKLRSVREQLGLQQRQLADRLEPKVSQGLISQWESNLVRSRPEPSAEHLRQIAEMTKTPWWTMCWFMDDAIDQAMSVNYHQDGSREMGPNLTDAEVDAARSQFTAQDAAPPQGWLVEWQSDPSRAYDLRGHFAKMPWSEDKFSLWPTLGSALRSTGAHQSLVAKAPPTLGDIAPKADFGPPESSDVGYEAASYQGSGDQQEDEEEDERVKRQRFWEAVKYYLGEDSGAPVRDALFNRTVSSGDIKQNVGYFEPDCAIQFLPATHKTYASTVKRRLREILGELFLIEKMQRRSVKKLILCYLTNHDLNSEQISTHFAEYVNSAQLLGVTVQFTSGPQATASAIADFIKKSADSRKKARAIRQELEDQHEPSTEPKEKLSTQPPPQTSTGEPSVADSDADWTVQKPLAGADTTRHRVAARLLP